MHKNYIFVPVINNQRSVSCEKGFENKNNQNIDKLDKTAPLIFNHKDYFSES
jgi:hypothetical protein